MQTINSNKNKAIKIEYSVKRGKKAGAVLTPHRYANGKYVVSKTRFKPDYVYVDCYSEILTYLQKGYKVRMSDADVNGGGADARLITKESLHIVQG